MLCCAVLGYCCRVFQNIDDWSFDVFHIDETGDGHSLKYVGYELLQRYNLLNKFKASQSL